MIALFVLALLQADPIGKYLADLEQQGLVPHETGSVEKIKLALAAAEDSLVAHDPRTATTILFGIVESPRFADFGDTPEYQNAEYMLGRALARGGAFGSARSYLGRVLARGPRAPYFSAAYRAMIDVALESKGEKGVLAALEGLPAKEPLPRDCDQELSYLRGKVAYERKDLSAAEAAFAAVDRRSRFYAASLYFRGLLRARRGDWKLAKDAFCEIIAQPDKDRFSFFIDQRYFPIKDLAYLALGRISHEQGQYDEAYYFYFQVPDDSEKLPDALFEAAWSMFQKGEWEASRALLDQFDRLFPHSALAPESAVLRANLDLKTCAFDRARKELEELVRVYLPVLKEVERVRTDPSRRQKLYGRLLGRERAPGMDGQLLELLKVDARFFRFHEYAAGLDREAAESRRTIAMWRELADRQQRGKPRPAATETTELLREVRALEPVAAGDPELKKRVDRLLGEVWRAATPVVGDLPFAKEARAAAGLSEQALELRGRLDDAATTLADESLSELDGRLKNLLRQARIGQIDAIIGKKKKLEIEISNLSRGRFPPEMFGKLHVEGLIGDDEEYWPFEGEYWADEYENYK